MRRFKDIIEDIKAPSIQNLWLNGGKLKYYGEKGWQDIKGQSTPTVKWDDIEDKPKTFTPSSHTHTKSDITDFPTLAAVATSGSYNDLSNKPTIPSAYTLPIASASALGGVKSATTGTTSGRDYKVQINSDGTMKVNVPWTDTNSSAPTVADSSTESDLDISDEEENVLMRLANGHIKTKYFDSSELSNKKYVDCIGDSLTMGASWLGWYETNLQTLLGSRYTVRNWGVGGETKSTIMARQGSASVKFSSSFILPANGTNVTLPLMTSRFDNGNVTPLLQGSTVDASHTSKMVNPCFISGVECEMTNSETTYYLKRKNVGNRDLVIDENAPILMNTGKQTKDAFITIVWFGTNEKPTSNEQSDALVSAYERVVTQLPNSNFIFVGLHTLGKTLAEYYENAMFKKFGNKFFNIREYCCSDILYDAGITPTQADLENMANGICPASALYDSTHFKPATNACIGKRLYEMIVQLGYINN